MSEQLRSTTDPDTREVAGREKEQIKGTAKDAASTVGDTATQRGQALKGQARGHARDLARTAQRQLHGHAHEETQRAGSALSTAGTQLRALADGRVEEAGAFGTYVEQAADAVNRWADTINDRGFDGLLDDLRSFGRRRPGAFLFGALAAGVLVGRFGRNVSQELGDDGSASAPTDQTGNRPVGSTSAGSAGTDDRFVAEHERFVAEHEHVGSGAESYSGGATVPPEMGEATRTQSDRDVVAGTPPTAVDEVRPTGSTRDDDLPDRGRIGDDLIVGRASDDQGVVVPPDTSSAQEVDSEGRPVSPTQREDDIEYLPIEEDQERRR